MKWRGMARLLAGRAYGPVDMFVQVGFRAVSSRVLGFFCVQWMCISSLDR